jgi:hypothetical protein
MTDNGKGMTESERARIFEPFFNTKAPGKGTGLGLSMVYGLVTKHNGHIECTSNPGEGTTFSIYLPAIKQEIPLAVEKKEGPAPAWGHRNYTYCDDGAICRELGGKYLKNSGTR